MDSLPIEREGEDANITNKTAKNTPAKKRVKLSAIDAAAQVLAGAVEPMNSKQIVEPMPAKKLWTNDDHHSTFRPPRPARVHAR